MYSRARIGPNGADTSVSISSTGWAMRLASAPGCCGDCTRNRTAAARRWVQAGRASARITTAARRKTKIIIAGRVRRWGAVIICLLEDLFSERREGQLDG